MTLLKFPSESIIRNTICKNPRLDHAYLNNNGITKAIAELAAKRFANQEFYEEGVLLGASTIIADLLMGVDGYTKEKVLNISKLVTKSLITGLENATFEALMKCAEKV